MRKRILAAILALAMVATSYTPQVYAQATDDYPNTGETAATLALGTQLAGTINDKDDKDYFAITTSSNKSFYTLAVENRSDVIVRFELFKDAAATSRVGYETAFYSRGSKSVNYGQLEANTTYYVRVSGSSSANYAFTMLEAVDTVGDTALTASAIALNSTVEGKLVNKNDRNVYSFTTSSNKSFYSFVIENRSEDTLVATVYEDVYETKPIKQHVYITKKSRGNIDLASLIPGQTYYVSIDGDQDVDQPYAVTAVETVDDYVDNTTGAAAAKLTKKITGAIQNNVDVDCFVMTAPKATVDYKVEIANTGSASLSVVAYSDVNLINKIDSKYVYSNSSAILTLTSVKKSQTVYFAVSGDAGAVYEIKVSPAAKAINDFNVTAIKKGFKLKVSKQGTINGYEVRYKKYGTSKWKKVTYKTSKNLKKNLKGLKSRTTYVVQVRAYYTYNKKKCYSDWKGYGWLSTGTTK